jgi:hypothetical protein
LRNEPLANHQWQQILDVLAAADIAAWGCMSDRQWERVLRPVNARVSRVIDEAATIRMAALDRKPL